MEDERGPLGFLKRTPKPVRKDPTDREKSRGAREYDARVHERRAERLELAGDGEGAAAARAAAAEARVPPPRGSR
jgi:hypothetical protein